MAYVPNPRISEEVAEMEFRERERRLQRDLNTSHEDFTPRSGFYRVLPSIVVLVTIAVIVAVVVIHFW